MAINPTNSLMGWYWLNYYLNADYYRITSHTACFSTLIQGRPLPPNDGIRIDTLPNFRVVYNNHAFIVLFVVRLRRRNSGISFRPHFYFYL